MNEEQLIQRGFNAGYTIEQFDPGLSQTLQKGFQQKDDPFVSAFIEGSQEFIRERARTRLLSNLKDMNQKNLSEKDKGMDIEK
jgi:hypothetical protein